MKFYSTFNVQDWQSISIKCLTYYKNLNSFVKVNGFTKVINHHELLENVVELKDIFNNFNLNCIYAAYVVVHPDTEQYLHKDQGTKFSRLLWPIQNCEKTYVKFYKVNESKINYKISKTYEYHYYDLNDSTEIGEYELTQPMFVNLRIPHYIHVNKLLSSERISLYFMFDPDPIKFLL